ncbi:hypothetical protein ACRARG_12500 [Pseudooceanicola sp. C21-150M6]|uniref:hypothetical protein n=1 Tax=Pseudooceanicola sp. C21-150M6 TaxID=3434355 RepID=UPI003D7FBAAC
MPRNTNVSVPTDEWTQLTANDVTEISFQNAGGYAMLVNATVGATQPNDEVTGYVYAPGSGEVRISLADSFLGVSGANRVWARGISGTTSAMVSHA